MAGDAPQATPGQAAAVPAAYARWYRADEPDATSEQIAGDWRIEPMAYREFWTAVEAENASLREQHAKALAANQRWAETLGDIQKRHTEVKRERDAHKLRADHYEGLWRAEHGLPPDTPDPSALLLAAIREKIAAYHDGQTNPISAFGDIVRLLDGSGA